MLHYIFDLLPRWLQAIIQPEIDDLIVGFHKLETKLTTVVGRHEETHAVLTAIKAEIEGEIADTKNEIERAKRIAERVKALVA